MKTVLKWFGIVIGAIVGIFVLLVILAALFGGGRQERAQAPIAKATATATDSPTATPSPKPSPTGTTVRPTATPKPTPTAPPKAKPTATPTLKPTVTATPVPTKAALAALEILSHQSYIDSGWFHIVGEVRNNSGTSMEYVTIIATLYDDADKVVGTDFTYTELDVIPSGGKAPFETGTDKWAGTTHYKLQVQGRPGRLPRQDIVIVSHDSYVDGDWFHVLGEVQNSGTTPAKYVKMVVTLYDAVGNVVGTDFTYTELDVIPPGGTSPFETGTAHWPNFDRYEVQVQAR